MKLIIYTTNYREGSLMFLRAAQTLQKRLISDNEEVVVNGLLHKKELIQVFKQIQESDKLISEFHFIGHSGMYGPMFGTRQYPEQFSPHEIRNLSIPFANHAKAFFHCCRSARWFAPFFAKEKKVTTFGYFWYTTFSSDPEVFKSVKSSESPVYAVGCKGKKSHGWIGSIKKYLGREPLEKLNKFDANDFTKDRSYNKIAEKYDALFQDITVRKDEWHWLKKHLPIHPTIRVLDIGSGNGALLKALSPHIDSGMGVDVSEEIIKKAIELNTGNHKLEFKKIDGPFLPLPDHSVDLVISLLSFRYLDWDPMMLEIKRVLKPGGKVLIIDMVAVPLKLNQIHQFIYFKIRHIFQRYQNPEFYKNLRNLVNDPEWKYMLKYNPIRAEHEMKWYLESRFPGKKTEKINIGYHSSMLAFDSGNIDEMQDIQLSYP